MYAKETERRERPNDRWWDEVGTKISNGWVNGNWINIAQYQDKYKRTILEAKGHLWPVVTLVCL